MKICYFGNPQTIHLQRWVRYFIDKGHEVHIVTPEPSEIEGAYIHDVSRSTSSFFYRIPIGYRLFYFLHKRWVINRLRKTIAKIAPDILDAQYLTSYGIPASRLGFHPFVITIWGSDILLAPQWFGEKHVLLMKRALEKADMIVCDGENTRKEIMKLGKDAGDVKLIRLGVDTQ